MDNTLFPKKFLTPDVEMKSFIWVYKNKPDFVDFTLQDMDNPTGFFKVWKDYCINKQKSNAESRSDNETVRSV